MCICIKCYSAENKNYLYLAADIILLHEKTRYQLKLNSSMWVLKGLLNFTKVYICASWNNQICSNLTQSFKFLIVWTTFYWWVSFWSTKHIGIWSSSISSNQISKVIVKTTSRASFQVTFNKDRRKRIQKPAQTGKSSNTKRFFSNILILDELHN